MSKGVYPTAEQVKTFCVAQESLNKLSDMLRDTEWGSSEILTEQSDSLGSNLSRMMGSFGILMVDGEVM